MDEFAAWAKKRNGFTPWHPVFSEMTGELVVGIVLARIVYWYTPDATGRTKLRVVKWGDYWIAKSHQEFADELGISVAQARRAINVLTDQGYIKVRNGKFNNVRVQHVQLDMGVFDEAFRNATRSTSEVSRSTSRNEPQRTPITDNTSEDTTLTTWQQFWKHVETILGGTVSAFLAGAAEQLYEEAKEEGKLDTLLQVSERAASNTLSGRGHYGIPYLRAGYNRETAQTRRAYQRHHLPNEQDDEGSEF